MNNELAKNKSWDKRVCTQCGGSFFVLPEWDRPPRSCETCRVKKINNKQEKLTAYFRSVKKKAGKKLKLNKEEQQELKEIEKIEKRLAYLNHLYWGDERQVFEELALLKRVRVILLKKDKEARKGEALKRNKRHKANLGLEKGSQFTGFVQGGSPGLKK